jgi:hypothetical protein
MAHWQEKHIGRPGIFHGRRRRVLPTGRERMT